MQMAAPFQPFDGQDHLAQVNVRAAANGQVDDKIAALAGAPNGIAPLDENGLVPAANSRVVSKADVGLGAVENFSRAEMANSGPIADRFATVAPDFLVTNPSQLPTTIAYPAGLVGRVRGSGDPLIDGEYAFSGIVLPATSGSWTRRGPEETSATTVASSLNRSEPVARPADRLASWTASSTATQALAASIAENATFSIVTGGRGRALRITQTSAQAVGPIFMDTLRPGEILDGDVTLRRFTDAPSDNTLTLRFRLFDKNEANLGTYTLQVVTLVAADGSRTYPYSVASDAILATFPTATRFRRNVSSPNQTTAWEAEEFTLNYVTPQAAPVAADETYYSKRPASALSSWTTSTTATPIAATPLTVGGIFSIGDGDDGQVLIADGGGSIGIGPIALDRFYPGETYKYDFILKRNIDATNNNIRIRMSSFTSGLVSLGLTTIDTVSVSAAQGLTILSYNVDTKMFPATMALGRPVLVWDGTDGQLATSAIRRSAGTETAVEQSYGHSVATGFSGPSTTMAEDHLVFLHGQSLAGGQNLTSDALVATVAKYPGVALSMEVSSNPGTSPRLSGTAPDTYVDLIEHATGVARETMVSGLVNHVLQRFEYEQPALATCTVAGGVVTSATITRKGRGYISVPSVTVNNTGTGGTGGTGAAFAVTLDTVENGGWTLSIAVTNPGSGYTSAPTLTIAGNGSGIAMPRMVGATAYKVGARYSQLKLGEDRGEYLDKAMRAAKKLSKAAGRTAKCYAWVWKQGEADLVAGLSRTGGDFDNWMRQYYNQRSQAVKEILGQTIDPVLIIDPAATCHPEYDQWSQPYPRGLELIRQHPFIRLTGGSYVHPHSDASHKTSIGYNHAGQGVGRAYAAEIWGTGWTDIFPSRAWRFGTTAVRVEFETPANDITTLPRPALVIDTSGAEITHAGIQGYYGFAARSLREGRVVPIISHSVGSDGRTITFTFGDSVQVVDASAVGTSGDTIAVADTCGWETGMRVRIASSGTVPNGLSAGVDYWVIRSTATLIKLAASLAAANAGTAVDITSTGSGSHTLTVDGTVPDGPLQLVYATRRNPGNTNNDGPVLGARGCLRNTRAEVNIYDGYQSNDWATPFDIVAN